MRNKHRIVAVVWIAIFLSACGSSASSLIVGKWQAGEPGFTITAEFARDGQAKITMLGQTLQGTYTLNGDGLEWTLNGQTTKMKVKVTATEMELTSEGKTIKYKKM
jgi:hypothetical protein